jgi:hypothetical protein
LFIFLSALLENGNGGIQGTDTGFFWGRKGGGRIPPQSEKIYKTLYGLDIFSLRLDKEKK